jgi:DNA replication protein DnaC
LPCSTAISPTFASPLSGKTARVWPPKPRRKELSHLDYLAQLAEGEASLRQDRTVARRIKAARFPVIKTLDSFRWDWPKKINRLQIQDLFRLQFVEDKANVIFLGLVGLPTYCSSDRCCS